MARFACLLFCFTLVGLISGSPSIRKTRQTGNGLVTCPGIPGYCSTSYPGDTCLVVCAFGRNNVPECQEDGTWTDDARCIEHEPGIPEQITGYCPGIPGYCSLGETGNHCTFQCATGPHIDSYCTPDGTWDPYPTCEGDIRETQDGCNPCPGPFGGPRNRTLEAAQRRAGVGNSNNGRKNNNNRNNNRGNNNRNNNRGNNNRNNNRGNNRNNQGSNNRRRPPPPPPPRQPVQPARQPPPPPPPFGQPSQAFLPIGNGRRQPSVIQPARQSNFRPAPTPPPRRANNGNRERPRGSGIPGRNQNQFQTPKPKNRRPSNSGNGRRNKNPPPPQTPAFNLRNKNQIESAGNTSGVGRCPGNSLEVCIDVCPSFTARIFGACVAGCARRCPSKK